MSIERELINNIPIFEYIKPGSMWEVWIADDGNRCARRTSDDFAVYGYHLVTVGGKEDWYAYWKTVYEEKGKFLVNDCNMDEMEDLANRNFPDKNIRVLDAGCGWGEYTWIFDKLGYEVVGVDNCKALMETAKSSESVKHLNFVHGDVENLLDFENDSFDLYFSRGMISYFENLEPLIREMGRVVKTGGLAVLTFPHFNRVKLEIFNIIKPQYKYSCSSDVNQIFYSVDEVLSIARTYGFELRNIDIDAYSVFDRIVLGDFSSVEAPQNTKLMLQKVK